MKCHFICLLQGFLNTLDQNGCTEETLKEVLYPLQLACSSNMVKVVELALGCLHKLVAHAWLHGESTASGTMDMLSAHGSLDDDDTGGCMFDFDFPARVSAQRQAPWTCCLRLAALMTRAQLFVHVY